VLAVGVALPVTRELFADRRVHQHSIALLRYVTLVRIPPGTVPLEETLFRGALFGSGPVALVMQGRGGVGSSLLFALWHLLPARGLPGFNPLMSASARARCATCSRSCSPWWGPRWAGALFCWLRLRAHSLLARPSSIWQPTAYATAWAVLRAC